MMFMDLNAKDRNQSDANKSYLKSSLSNKNSTENAEQINNRWSNKLISNDNTISYERENKASDKKNFLQQKINSLKNVFKQTFSSNVYKPLSFYEFHMIEHLYTVYQETPFEKIAQAIPQSPYVDNYLQILAFTEEIVSTQEVNESLRHQTKLELAALIKKIKRTRFSKSPPGSSKHYLEMQVNIILMICTFKGLQKNYSPYERRVIKRIFNQLSADSFMNTMETLRYLENQRPEIQNMPQLSQEELSKRNNQILMATYDRCGREGVIPKIELKKVSQNERRKVVNILISGFLSQDQDKRFQWQSLLNCMPDSEVYGLDWESETIGQLVGFMAGSVKDLVLQRATLEDKFRDNPFNPAFTVAQESGKYLAYLVHELFPDQFINIIGYSLGTELIKEFVEVTLRLNQGKNLQKVVLLGGVSDSHEYHDILEKCAFPLSITNMYTDKDSVLQILLKRCRKGIKPVGLKELLKSFRHCVNNTDVSNQISGHLAYMTNFDTVADLLQLNEE